MDNYVLGSVVESRMTDQPNRLDVGQKNSKFLPRDYCTILKNDYNGAEVDDAPVEDLCVNNQIKLFSSDL